MQVHQIALAIFPFEDLSPKKDPGIFCRSLSDDLIIELSRFRQLRIVKVSFNILGNDPQNVPVFLKEGYFINGTFRSEKDIVRINVQLYETNSHRLVWGNRLEGKLTDLNDLQDNLLRSLVAVLQKQINIDLLSKIKQRPKIDFTAYEHWLYGIEELKRASLNADIMAREHFEKALQIQPEYALACMGLSLSYFNEWSCQLWDRWDISKSGAFKWAQKAAELDDQNHIIALVLGRVFLYEESYNTAEYYFRKSLTLNPNDPDTLFTISGYLVYLGLLNEALELFERGLQIYPDFAPDNFRFGGVIHFELGNFEKAETYIEYNKIGRAKIADTDAYCAATYYYLGKYDKMKIYWESFLDTFRRIFNRERQEDDESEAINWIIKLNPFRGESKIEGFLKFIAGNKNFEIYQLKKTIPQADSFQEYFMREGGSWKLSLNGAIIQAPELKGFYDIQKMLTRPYEFYHCAELMGSTLEDKGEKLIDEKAKKQYHKKILDIQTEMEEAEQLSDFDRLEKLQQEYDHLIEHLSRSLNLKGGIREIGSTVEKARSAVTWRIRNAIARIEKYHPMLGAHLSNSIKTGTLCCYKPDRKLNWITS